MLVMAAFPLFRGRVGSEAAPFSLSVYTLLGSSSLCGGGELHQSKRGWSGHLVQAGEQAVAVEGNQPELQVVFSLFPPPCSLGVSKCVHALHEWSVSFLTALW